MTAVSVIIPTFNRARKVVRAISSVLYQTFTDYEVIVVDDGLEPQAKDFLDECKERVKVLRSSHKGPSYARNLAAQHTDAAFLAFTDADCLVDKCWLLELQRAFEECPDAVSSGGIQRLPKDATEFEKKIYLFMKKNAFMTGSITQVILKKKFLSTNLSISQNDIMETFKGSTKMKHVRNMEKNKYISGGEVTTSIHQTVKA